MAYKPKRVFWSAACLSGGALLFGPSAGGQSAKPDFQAMEARKTAAQLLLRVERGSMKLTNPHREGMQLRELARQGIITGQNEKPVRIALPLLRTLDRLSAQSSRSKPLELMSLYRSPRSRSSGSAHASGQAVDIASFGGYRIDSREPEKCVKGTVALLAALGPGQYRLGLPKPPRTDPQPLMPAPLAPRKWPFFPAPIPFTAPLLAWRVVLPEPPAVRTPKPGRPLRPWVARWANERGAPLEEVADRRVRLAVRQAEARGARVYSLFPDALDHLHLDVRPLSKR